MAPSLTEDEIDDLLYFARTGENGDLSGDVSSLSAREGASPAEILTAARDEAKSTCLHMATGNGHLDTVRLVLSHFAEPETKKAFLDATNESGNTAMHWAALGGHLETVKVLVAEGAAQALANEGDYVPLDLALSRGHQAVVDYFFEVSRAKEAENGLEGAVEGVELEEGGEGEEGGEASEGRKEGEEKKAS